jgi:hypothetical protein
MKKKILMLSAVMVVLFGSCDRDKDNTDAQPEKKLRGYIYTTTNGSGENQVVRFSRFSDGSLDKEKAFGTNSNGGANVAAGGDAHGDFDSQGAVQIIDNYLLNVNAGGNTVSVFGLNKTNGELIFKGNTNSGGTRPVSIAYQKKSASSNEYWVIVGNQWNNPNVQKEGSQIERYPNDAWFATDLSAADATDQQRNISLFSFSTTTGVLTFERVLDTYARANGGPTTVSFSKDGNKLAVSTWGIAHFMTPNTSLAEQHPSRVYVYDFSNSGIVVGKRYFEEIGIAGTIGFSWSKQDNSTIYASNFNLTPEKRANSVTVLKDNGTIISKVSNLGTTPDNAINEACWTLLNPIGNRLYVASFATNLISSFDVSSSGLNFVSYNKRRDVAPAGDSKDMYTTPDHKQVYVLGAFQSFSINTFDVTADGVNYKSQKNLTTTTPGGAGKYNFLGLNGFEL